MTRQGYVLWIVFGAVFGAVFCQIFGGYAVLGAVTGAAMNGLTGRVLLA